MTEEESEKRIASAMAQVHAKHLESNAVRSKRLTFHLHDEEFEEIRATAKSLDMSVADYFCALHRHAVKRLGLPGTEAEWVLRTPRGNSGEEAG